MNQRAQVVPSAAPPDPSETIERPEPGTIARGRWEAPWPMFVVVAVLAALGGIAWLVVALRMRTRRRAQP